MGYVAVHIKDPGGFDVRCDRKSKWGNPFAMKGKSDAERARVIQEYRKYLWNEIQNNNGVERLLIPLIERKNKQEAGSPLRLACWCKPKDCHCDVLIRACEWYESTIAH